MEHESIMLYSMVQGYWHQQVPQNGPNKTIPYMEHMGIVNSSKEKSTGKHGVDV